MHRYNCTRFFHLSFTRPFSFGGRLVSVIFKSISEGRPYPEHGLITAKDWSRVPPRKVRLADLITTKRTLNLDTLLSEDSTFFGDLFAHIVEWKGELYLEDGLHRALRAALQQRELLHARVVILSDDGKPLNLTQVGSAL